MLIKAGIQVGNQCYLIKKRFQEMNRKWLNVKWGFSQKVNVEVAFMTIVLTFILEELVKAIRILQVEDVHIFTAV